MEKLLPTAYLQTVIALYQEKGDPEVAQGQMKYMRNQFDYFGLKAKEWYSMAKDFYKKHGLLYGDELKELVRMCYEEDQRELQYFAVEMVQRAQKKEEEDFIDFFEELICHKSWWDTVDWLAKLVGFHFKRFPHLIKPVTKRWMASDNMWLQRVSIIFQLFYKENTDTDLMFDYILQVADSKEFFLQKAAGWALRQHSKTDGAIVVDFIEKNDHLAPLTKREGLKWLKSRGLLS